jgi:hypothetical protein
MRSISPKEKLMENSNIFNKFQLIRMFILMLRRIQLVRSDLEQFDLGLRLGLKLLTILCLIQLYLNKKTINFDYLIISFGLQR